MFILDPVLRGQERGLQDMANSILETISNEFAYAAEKVGSSVVAVHARRWMPTRGIEWKKGVVVTVHHGVQRDEDYQSVTRRWTRGLRETGGTGRGA
jgi:hypothetical protein